MALASRRKLSRKRLSIKSKKNKMVSIIKKMKTKKLRQKKRRVRFVNKQLERKGGGFLPSSISQIGYSVIGTGQSIMDGWNGKQSSYAYINPSPESQAPINGLYQSNHGKI
jgi:hypothetical protein